MADRTLAYRRLSDIHPNPRNSKTHDRAGIMASVLRFGFIEAITEDGRDGSLLSGHGRVESVADLLAQARAAGDSPPDGIRVSDDGEWELPIVCGWSSSDDAEQEAALVALNRHVETGGWDTAGLVASLQRISEQSRLGLQGVGFNTADLAGLRLSIKPPPAALTDPDDVPDAPETPITKPGDLWILGGETVCPDCGHHNPVGA